MHQGPIQLWENREQYVDDSEPHDQDRFDKYLKWFHRSTRVHIKAPLPEHAVDEDSGEEAREDVYDTITELATELTNMSNVAARCLHRSRRQDLGAVRQFLEKVRTKCKKLAQKLSCVDTLWEAPDEYVRSGRLVARRGHRPHLLGPRLERPPLHVLPSRTMPVRALPVRTSRLLATRTRPTATTRSRVTGFTGTSRTRTTRGGLATSTSRTRSTGGGVEPPAPVGPVPRGGVEPPAPAGPVGAATPVHPAAAHRAA